MRSIGSHTNFRILDPIAKKAIDLFKGLGSVLPWLVLFLGIFTLASCTSDSGQSETKSLDSTAYLLEGKNLSQQYCISCHMYATPDLLPVHIWKEEVLPRMGAFLGIYERENRAELLEGGDARKFLLANNIYPPKPAIDSSDWEKIKAYILHEAPEALDNRTAKLEIRNVFEGSTPRARIAPPMATMIQYESQSGLIYHGDVKKDYSTINIFNADLEPVQSLGVRSPPSIIREKNGELWALLMGSFTSTDEPSGRIVKFTKDNGSEQYNSLTNVISGLQRPVDMAFADFDHDGDEDVVVAQFGNWAGKLEWFENKGSEQYDRHLLINKTGPSQVITEDLNNDGLTDILAMITQGDESIYALINQGEGNFREKRLLQLPPTYGSVTFEYLDMDNDGIKDIVHVAGDNADYEAILKPYHGIRIFKGLDSLSFQETYFYPVHGAYKGLPADYDGDGDLDIAVISFFPGYPDSAGEALMMLENKSIMDSLIFEGFTISGYDIGRWNVMDKGDIGQDGKPDLLLGSYVIRDPYGRQENVAAQWMKDSPMLLVLKNQWYD